MFAWWSLLWYILKRQLERNVQHSFSNTSLKHMPSMTDLKCSKKDLVQHFFESRLSQTTHTCKISCNCCNTNCNALSWFQVCKAYLNQSTGCWDMQAQIENPSPIASLDLDKYFLNISFELSFQNISEEASPSKHLCIYGQKMLRRDFEKMAISMNVFPTIRLQHLSMDWNKNSLCCQKLTEDLGFYKKIAHL